MNSQFVIDITQNLQDFKHKLEFEPRVILSARFGDGKTFFLKRFQEVYSDEYQFFTIYPAQYVIGSNEAIFEYIKRDLLFQIVDRGMLTGKYDLVGMIKEIMEYVDVEELLSFFLSKPVAMALGNAVKGLKNLRAFLRWHPSSASKYLNSFLSVRGGLYENDAYTCLIQKCFEKMRLQEGKQIVLIIEDLDRIDPQNIFSILNIFGSHFDRHYVVGEEEQENKFGVDRFITVMDYDNLERLYDLQYGEDARGCFDGYIAKYICSKPFRYSIRAEARKVLTEKIYAIYGFSDPNDLGMKQKLSQDMSEMSIRDLERAYLFDPIKALRNPDEPVIINGIKLSPTSPIVLAQAYRLFFGLSCTSTRSTAKPPQPQSQVEAMGPLLILGSGADESGYYPSTGYIEYDKYEHYQYTPFGDGNDCISCFKFHKTMSFNKPCLKWDEEISIWRVESLFEPYFYYAPEPEDEIFKDDYQEEDEV